MGRVPENSSIDALLEQLRPRFVRYSNDATNVSRAAFQSSQSSATDLALLLLASQCVLRAKGQPSVTADDIDWEWMSESFQSSPLPGDKTALGLRARFIGLQLRWIRGTGVEPPMPVEAARGATYTAIDRGDYASVPTCPAPVLLQELISQAADRRLSDLSRSSGHSTPAVPRSMTPASSPELEPEAAVPPPLSAPASLKPAAPSAVLETRVQRKSLVKKALKRQKAGKSKAKRPLSPDEFVGRQRRRTRGLGLISEGDWATLRAPHMESELAIMKENVPIAAVTVETLPAALYAAATALMFPADEVMISLEVAQKLVSIVEAEKEGAIESTAVRTMLRRWMKKMEEVDGQGVFDQAPSTLIDGAVARRYREAVVKEQWMDRVRIACDGGMSLGAVLAEVLTTIRNARVFWSREAIAEGLVDGAPNPSTLAGNVAGGVVSLGGEMISELVDLAHF